MGDTTAVIVRGTWPVRLGGYRAGWRVVQGCLRDRRDLAHHGILAIQHRASWPCGGPRVCCTSQVGRTCGRSPQYYICTLVLGLWFS